MNTACDTHIHVYDSRRPTAPTATLTPPDANLSDYAHVQSEIGTGRFVLVQPTTYGLDNSLHLESLVAAGDVARGVMVVTPSITHEELATMTEQGVRGARMHLLPGGAVDRDDLEAVAARIAPFGWHVQLQLNGHELVGELDRLRRLPCPIVIDHVGRFMPPVGPDDAAFSALLALVDDGAHVKLSAPYESAPDPAFEYAVVSSCVDALVARAPDRLLWASNWPHPGQVSPPTSEALVELRSRWLPTEHLQHTVLVHNPGELYGF